MSLSSRNCVFKYIERSLLSSVLCSLKELITVSYSTSLEKLELSFRALAFCFKSINIPATATTAANAISEIMRISNLIISHIDEVAQQIRQVIASDVDIFDKIRVVEGYVSFAGMVTPEEEIPSKIGILIEAFGVINLDACDSTAASNILKLVFAISKALSTTVPAKLRATAWRQGAGKEMKDWFRRVVATFSRRFGDDFETMEVLFWSI